jgi:sulfatase maturation enzyme AslB (radical SAM superfamily)
MSGPKEHGELHPELLAVCIEDAAKLGYRQLAVSGGEPLLYAPLKDLLVHAQAFGMLTTITTNGMLITSRRWGQLSSYVDIVAISIDGTPWEHNTIRGQDGAFERTIGNLSVIRASEVPFGFIFTLTQHNVDSLEFVVRLAAEHGARSVQVHPLTLRGRAATMLPDSQPDAIELVTALFEATRLGSELGVAVHVDAVTIEQLLIYRNHVVPDQPISSLLDVAPTLIVEANSIVIPLTHEVSHTLRLGSLADARLLMLAQAWLVAGHGERLANACELTWNQLTSTCSAMAVYWYEEVAARTRTYVVDSESSIAM